MDDSQHADFAVPEEASFERVHSRPVVDDWLLATGELANLIRTTDWSSTPLGPRQRWPQSLRTVVGIVVESKLPMVLLWGPELILLYNDACRPIYADRHPGALGRQAHEVWSETWHLSEPVISAVMSRGEAVFREDVPFSIRRRGHLEHACFTLAHTPVRVEDGSIGGVFVTMQETTAAVERSRQLRESEARFRVVVESSRDGINMLDLKTGEYVFMSPAQVALTGFSAEEINGFSAEEALGRVHPDDRHLSLEQQRRIAAGEDPGGTLVEYRWKVESGEYRWFSDSRTLVRDEQGQPVALVGVSRDVTERKRAEDALRASEQKYAAIFANSPFALALSRMPDVTFVAVNDAFLRMFECSRDEVIGKTSVDVAITDAASQAEVRAELLARGAVRDLECTRTTRSGAQRHLSLNVDWVSIGGEQHVLTTIQDVTSRKEAEEVRRLYEQTKALDELKTRFFASISHELRTPLALVLGPTERHLAAADTPPAVRRDLAVVVRNARTLLGLVDDLLDIARLDAGRMGPAYAEVDLVRLARRVADRFEVFIEEEHIAFSIEGPPRLAAEVDPEKLQRILLNLLSNAFKLTPSGGRVRLTLRETPERVCLEVADSGPGVPVERREAVFERFGRLDSSVTRRFGGAGLGLSIARELAVLHGGTISITDAPEGGARFVVELPRMAPPGVVVRSADEGLDRRSLARPRAAGEDRSAGPWVATAGTGPLVLVVEDNPDMSRFIAEVLGGEHRVAVAFDGKQGLEAAKALRPDLILCDLMMPEMSGEELVLAARRIPELDATPIVVLSAKADDQVRVKLLRAGAQDYLTKPFSVEELRARVSNLVARKLAEQAMRCSEAKFRGIIAIAADAIVSVDSRLAITEWNDGAERIFGYTRAEAIGASLQLLLPERYRAAHAKHIARFVAEPEAARRMEHGIAAALRKDGEELFIDATISKLELDGELIMTVAARDVTIQVRGELEQRVLADVGGALASLDYDEALANLVRITADAVADFVVVFATDERGALHRRAAASKDPAKAWLVDLMMYLPSSPRPSHPIWRAFHERSPSVVELDPEQYEAIAECPEHLRALQAAAPRHVMVLPLLAAGQCVGAMAFAAASRRFDAQDMRLAQEVARRCAMFVENARLHRIERRATQARDEVLGVVAHDLRNPLNAIMLQATLLRRKTGDPARRARAASELIDRCTDRMSHIIEDLLEVTRLEAGELRLARERVSVADLVATVIEMQKDQIESRSLELRADVAASLPEIWADEQRLLQVFENLIGNAAKFTTQGSITLGVERGEHEVVLRVVDTGPGIAAEHLPRLFDRFWQARDAKHGSLGLGLAIVKGIVEAHGGRIWVESEVGVGSAFFFTVPIAA